MVMKMDIDFWPKNPKPNFKKGKMNVTSAQITSYQLPVTIYHYINKPNSNPIYPELAEWNKANFLAFVDLSLYLGLLEDWTFENPSDIITAQ